MLKYALTQVERDARIAYSVQNVYKPEPVENSEFYRLETGPSQDNSQSKFFYDVLYALYLARKELAQLRD
jgi:hypothetical protein